MNLKKKITLLILFLFTFYVSFSAQNISVQLKNVSAKNNGIEPNTYSHRKSLKDIIPEEINTNSNLKYLYTELYFNDDSDTLAITIDTLNNNNGTIYLLNSDNYIKLRDFTFSRVKEISHLIFKAKFQININIQDQIFERTLDIRFFPKSKFILYDLRAYRFGEVKLKDSSYDIALELDPSASKFQLASGTYIYIDYNKDNFFNKRTYLDHDSNLVFREKFNLTDPFFLGNNSFTISKVGDDGKSISLSEYSSPNEPFLGFNAPDFSVINLTGETINLSDNPNMILILHFWSTSCPPCEIVRPYLNQLASKYSQRGDIRFLAITLDTDMKVIKRYLETRPINYEVVILSKKMEADYNAKTFPRDIIINKHGEIVFDETGGYKDRADIINKIISITDK